MAASKSTGQRRPIDRTAKLDTVFPTDASEKLSHRPLAIWHKPRVEKIEVALDTQGITGSDTDGFGGNEHFSDMRVKRDIVPFTNGLERLLADTDAPGAGQYVQLIPMLAVAIREQHSMLTELNESIQQLRAKKAR